MSIITVWIVLCVLLTAWSAFRTWKSARAAKREADKTE